MKKLLAVTVAMCALSSVALAKPAGLEGKTEAYAHPTLFKSQAQTLVDADSTYIVGGKILKSKNKITVGNKDNVYVKSWAKDVLDIIKESQMKAGATSFNPKAPTLRSEVATILAEGLNVEAPANYKPYSDIQDGYWAKDWIYKVTEKDIMIGYPSGVFKPDQPITKAEVFATVAKIINIDHSAVDVPTYKNQTMQYIPTWAYSATNEVIASNLLDAVPNSKGVIENEYLSKEQVAYLVASLRKNLAALQSGSAVSGEATASSYGVTTVNVKLLDRLSAKTSNIGEWFTAKTTESVVVDGTTFPEGSIVRGEVVAVQRPGVHESGYIKVKFNYIKNGDCKKCLPKQIASASVDDLKNPNILARLLGAPLTIVGRAAGVVGRSAGTIANVTGNGVEEVGDELANTLVETFTLHAGRGAASLGNSVVTILKGVYDITKVCVSGVFGVIYEVGDELIYVLVPSLSNSSSLNPNEELTIVF
ncbi:MAG: S-layer homology domain-containing protein [Candidatus Gastranaerophilales bacterium]|nr:S-layer homology domain-containing protein [Candidatus Gastranaerophilales bacterium]